MTSKEQKKAAADFAAKWAGKGYEKGECQKFWRGLLHDVFGVADPDDWVQYEVQVATGFVDAYISRTKVLIEQKGFEHGLADKAAMKQAMMYVGAMPDTMPVRYIVLSNFQEFWIYDKHSPEMKPVKVALKDLPKKLRVLSFLSEVEKTVTIVRDVAAVDKKAGELVGRLYKALLASYTGEVNERVLESLNMLCVRLVFCAYAEDSGVFPMRDQFVNYMRRYDAEAFRDRLAQLFRILNTDENDRDPDDIPALLEFPYVGSGLFDDEHIRIPRFTDETRTLLLDCMCADLDWTEINPTIFGAVFESTLSTAMRRKNGMHYTTVKNIHRVADPLFLWALEKELDEIAAIVNVKKRNEALAAFQKKLGRLRFLDPACGSGNFLTETYISLRRLENRAIALRQQGQAEFDLGDTICVTIDQFFGIEIDGFAVSVAQTALWIAESQMMIETERILHRRIDFLPLKRYAHIVKGNALRMDWNSLLPEGEHFDYILGNPPFVGQNLRSREQAEDMLKVFAGTDAGGKLDYVAAWFKITFDYMNVHPETLAAFVASNSLAQGESVGLLTPVRTSLGVQIDFAWRTFVWDSEAAEKAHVHVVIIGFSKCGAGEKILFEDDINRHVVPSINGYLAEGVDRIVKSRANNINASPVRVHQGSPSADDKQLSMSREERDALVAKYPELDAVLLPYVGSDEYINAVGFARYCIWMVGKRPSDFLHIPEMRERFRHVHDFRLACATDRVRKTADSPHLFTQIRQPQGDYILIPRVSSERRKYLPVGFMPATVIASESSVVAENASLVDFGLISSSVHNAWMRTVCGRLEMRYRYSPAVYYNFAQPVLDDDVRASIAATAQGILDARAIYADKPLSSIYGEDMYFYPEVLRAHEANDAAVLAAYGLAEKSTESEIVSRLFEMYARLTEKD